MLFAETFSRADRLTTWEKTLYWVCAASALLVAAAAVYGVLFTYTPVSDADIWDGLMIPYMRIQDGDWYAWWMQHCEHRPIITRLLFWVDLTWFGASGLFLFACNLSILALIATLFTLLTREIQGNRYPWLGWLLFAWLFLYTQAELFASPMASCFYLAYLLPLAALYLLHRSTTSSSSHHSSRLFYASLAVGVVAIGSQGNGLLTLPLMLVLAWVVKMPRLRVVQLGVAMVLCIGIYFVDYAKPPGLGSLDQALATQAMNVVVFVFGFFGSPFFWILGKGIPGGVAAVAAGGMLLGCGVLLMRKLWRQGHLSSFEMVLICFLVYLFISAVMAAGGRLVYGPSTSVSSRYTLPALLAWASVVTLGVSFWRGALRAPTAALIAAFVVVVMLPFQLQTAAAKVHDAQGYNAKMRPWLAMLALELGVRDVSAIETLHPQIDHMMKLADQARQRNAGLFGVPLLASSRELLGSTHPVAASGNCDGQISEVKAIPGEPHFWLVRGHTSGSSVASKARDYRRLLVIDGQSKVIGVLFRSNGAVLATTPANETFNTVGYVSRTTSAQTAFLIDEAISCSLAIHLPHN